MKKKQDETIQVKRIENLNDLAVRISQIEGKSEQVNIAQIKEVLAVIKTVYTEYVGGSYGVDVPYRIKQFIRLITGDEKLLINNITDIDDNFNMTLIGKYTNYTLNDDGL